MIVKKRQVQHVRSQHPYKGPRWQHARTRCSCAATSGASVTDAHTDKTVAGGEQSKHWHSVVPCAMQDSLLHACHTHLHETACVRYIACVRHAAADCMHQISRCNSEPGNGRRAVCNAASVAISPTRDCSKVSSRCRIFRGRGTVPPPKTVLPL